MLDENLKILSKSVGALQTEVADKKEKIENLIKDKKELESKLSHVYKE